MMIFTVAIYDRNMPLGLGAIVALIGLLITWATFGFAAFSFYYGQKKAKREEQNDLHNLIRAVCSEFTNSDDYQIRRDRAMITIASGVVDEAFRERSSSFVDAKADHERRTAMDARLTKCENLVAAVSNNLVAMTVTIARDVADEVRNVLREERKAAK